MSQQTDSIYDYRVVPFQNMYIQCPSHPTKVKIILQVTGFGAGFETS
jgi:hypothetical protein